MFSTIFITTEVRVIHKPNICTTGKGDFNNIPSFSLAKIIMYELHESLLSSSVLEEYIYFLIVLYPVVEGNSKWEKVNYAVKDEQFM
mgnify:CR=1 FL=1